MHRTSPLCTQNHKWNHKWNHKSKSLCKLQFFSHHLVFISIVFLQNKKSKNNKKKMKFPEMDTYPGEGHIDRFIAYTIKPCHVSFSKPCAHLGDFMFFFWFLFFLKWIETPWEQISKANKWDQPQTWASPHSRLPHAILTPSHIVLHRIRTATVAVPPK